MHKHVPSNHMLWHLPVIHVLGHRLDHVPMYVPKHVPARHMLGTMLEHMPKNCFLEFKGSRFC